MGNGLGESRGKGGEVELERGGEGRGEKGKRGERRGGEKKSCTFTDNSML